MNSIPSSTLTFLAGVTAGAIFVRPVCKSLYGVFQRTFYPTPPPTDQPFWYVPSHISEEARAFLKVATPVGGDLSDPNILQMAREGFRMATIEASNKAKESYVETVRERTLDGVSVLEVIPKNYLPSEKVIVYIHGGAWTLGNPDHLYQNYAPVAFKTGVKAIAVKYGKAPEKPFPMALNECFAVYNKLLETHKAEDIVFLGDSAGANLCIGTILKARQEGLALPSAVGLCSPMVDATGEHSDSLQSLKGRSPKIRWDLSAASSLNLYAQKTSRDNPLISVINADYSKGFPPTEIYTGTRDALLSDCTRLHRALEKAGIPSSIKLWEAMWHGFQEHDIPEAYEWSDRVADFFKQHLFRGRKAKL